MGVLIEWQSHLDLGIAPLDYQHREMVDLINLLADSLRGTSAADPAELLQRIHRHAREHFLYEEKLMLSIGFRDHVAHQREHAMLLGELKLIASGVASGQTALDEDLLRSLRQWYISHLVTSDREFAASYLQAHSAATAAQDTEQA